jgi:hypothetical protein
LSRISRALNEMLDKKRKGRSSSSAYIDKGNHAQSASSQEVVNTIRKIITTAINE